MADTTHYGWTKPTVNADSGTWGTILNTALDDIDTDLSASYPRGHIDGLTLSAAGSTATFGIAAGEAADTATNARIKLASAYTKTTSSWAVGTGNGALDTGAVANSTWYHVYLIKRVDTSVVDVLLSLSASAPTLPASYTLSRRIGSMKTDGSAQWVKFLQVGDRFLWDAPGLDTNITLGTTSTLCDVQTPPGLKTDAIVRCSASQGSGTMYGIVQSPDQASVAGGSVGFNNANLHWTAGGTVAVLETQIRTSTVPQIRAVASAASTTFTLRTVGWIDRRGRDA